MAISSLFIHALFFLVMTIFQPEAIETSERVEVEYISPQSQQVVTETDIEDLKTQVNELEKKARLLSEKFKRISKQTKAQKTGLTKNRSKRVYIKKAKTYAPQITDTAVDGLERKLKQKQPQFNLGESTISEHIPGVDSGHFTALDTDPFSFYGFYSRVHVQIRNRWVPKIINIAQRISPKALKKLAQKPRTTIVEIILDKEGYFQKAIVLKSSNYDYIDQAAIAPFKEASPLLNPPKGMIKEDGLIHIKYGFYLSWNPRKVVLK